MSQIEKMYGTEYHDPPAVLFLDDSHPDIPSSLPESEIHRLQRYASDTFRSLIFMGDTPTGLPDDRLVFNEGDITVRSHATTPTNIGLYLADLIAAKDLHLMSDEEVEARITQTLTTLVGVEKDHGLFFGWYNPENGQRLERHPSGGTIRPSISTVDNAWLAVGLMTVRAALPTCSEQVNGLLRAMDFRRLYDERNNFFYGEYFPDQNIGSSWYYEVEGSETRIASYVGISEFGIPAQSYRQLRKGPVLNGDQKLTTDEIIFSWGGSMFENLLVPQLVPEDVWSEKWRLSQLHHIKQQIEQGNQKANSYWGFSPCDDPDGRYREFGVRKLALYDGYSEDPVVTPHAAFLALPFDQKRAFDNLVALEKDFPAVYRENFGFFDSLDPRTGKVSSSMLCLDQSMTMLALANHLGNGGIRKYLGPQLEASIRSLFEESTLAPEAV